MVGRWANSRAEYNQRRAYRTSQERSTLRELHEMADWQWSAIPSGRCKSEVLGRLSRGIRQVRSYRCSRDLRHQALGSISLYSREVDNLINICASFGNRQGDRNSRWNLQRSLRWVISDTDCIFNVWAEQGRIIILVSLFLSHKWIWFDLILECTRVERVTRLSTDHPRTCVQTGDWRGVVFVVEDLPHLSGDLPTWKVQ